MTSYTTRVDPIFSHDSSLVGWRVRVGKTKLPREYDWEATTFTRRGAFRVARRRIRAMANEEKFTRVHTYTNVHDE